MKPEPHDEVLERELRRRSAGAWQPEGVLSAVRRGMQLRPERVSAAPRWAALAGLLGLLGVVAVLALALPRLPAGPAALSPTPEGGALPLLSTEDFTARLESGDLNGVSVLVEGAVDPIVHDVPKGHPGCGPSEDPECLDPLGTLRGAEGVLVLKRWIAVPESEASTRGGGRDGWQWWDSAEAPVEGVLLLSVDGSGGVEYVGRASGRTQATAASVTEVVASQPDTLQLDEVFVVDAWLHARGSKFVPACASPPAGERVCAEEESWLASGGEFDEATALQVQPSAYAEFSRAPDDGDADAGPRRGLYALARRLAVAGCDSSEDPCWTWQIVARVAAASPAVPAPPPSPEASDPGPIESPIPAPTSPAAPVPTPLVEVGEPFPARWDIAPSARPDPASTSIEVQVWELQCASGQSPEGRILPPEIEYSAQAVVITFSVHRAPGAQECPGSPPASYVVELEESLGNRLLLDGSMQEQTERLRFDDGLLVLGAEQASVMAYDRLAAALGPEGCPQMVEHDREERPEDFERWADEIESGEGLSPRGNAFLGEPLDAARAFGAFEAYRGPDGWYFMAVATGQPWLGIGQAGVLGADIAPGSLIVADLYPGQLADGRTLWLPAYTQHSAGTIACVQPGDSAATGIATWGDFELQLRAGRSVYLADEPIDIEGALSYTGPEPSIAITGQWLAFGFEQLDGDLEMSPLWTQMCVPATDLHGDAPFRSPYAKSGGYSPDDENAEFYRRYLDQPQLRLPPGTYRIFALSSFSIGDCFGQHVSMEASIVITVR